MRSSVAGLTRAPCGRWCDPAVSALGRPWCHGVSQEVCACQPRAGRPSSSSRFSHPSPRPPQQGRVFPCVLRLLHRHRHLPSGPCTVSLGSFCSQGFVRACPTSKARGPSPGPACCCLPPRLPCAPGLASSWSRLCPACLSATSGSLAFILRLLLSGPGCRAGRAAPSCLSHPVSLCSSLPASAAP